VKYVRLTVRKAMWKPKGMKSRLTQTVLLGCAAWLSAGHAVAAPASDATIPGVAAPGYTFVRSLDGISEYRLDAKGFAGRKATRNGVDLRRRLSGRGYFRTAARWRTPSWRRSGVVFATIFLWCCSIFPQGA